MKFIKVVGLVLFFHAALLGILFFQPGCQTMESSNTVVEAQSVKADEYYLSCEPETCPNEAWTVIEESAPVKNTRVKPTRPVQGTFECTATAKAEISHPVASFAESSVQVVGEPYVVKSGDSLWVLAKRNEVTVADLARVNGIDRNSVLKVGQKLTIPARKGSAGVVAPSIEGSSYTIAKGDTLSEIAARFHVSVDALKNANGMRDNVIYAGKKIVIPGVNAETVTSVSKHKSPERVSSLQDGNYQVKNGDTLSVIAARHGVSVNDLMKWNNIANASKLRAGQMLKVTGASTKAAAVPTASVPTLDKMGDLDTFMPEPTEEPSEEYGNFELFEDDMLFDTSGEIPVITVVEE